MTFLCDRCREVRTVYRHRHEVLCGACLKGAKEMERRTPRRGRRAA